MEPIYSPLASDDLEEIWDFIAQDSEVEASRFIGELIAVSNMLAESPMAGRTRSSLKKGMRSFPHGNYLVFYEIVHERVKLLRIVHGARNLHDLFR